MESEPKKIREDTPKIPKTIAARKIKEESKKRNKKKTEKQNIKKIFEYVNED